MAHNHVIEHKKFIPYICQVTTSSQEVLVTTNTPVTWSRDYDPFLMHDQTNTSRIYNNLGYPMSFFICFRALLDSGGATFSTRQMSYVNSSRIEYLNVQATDHGSGITEYLQGQGWVQMNNGDYLELVLWHNNGTRTYTNLTLDVVGFAGIPLDDIKPRLEQHNLSFNNRLSLNERPGQITRYVLATHSTTQSISDTTNTVVSFDTANDDIYGILNTSNGRFTNTMGMPMTVLLIFNATYTDGSVPYTTRSGWRVDGGALTYICSVAKDSTLPYTVPFIRCIQLPAGSYVEFYTWQNDGDPRTLNEARAAVLFLRSEDAAPLDKIVTATRSAAQTITTASDTPITFTAQLVDTGYNMWNSSAATILAPRHIGNTGVYLYTVSGSWTNQPTTEILYIGIEVNGTLVAYYKSERRDSTIAYAFTASKVIRLSSGDYVKAIVRQTSGNNRDIELVSASLISLDLI